MIDLSKIDLSGAEETFALANTPFFLMKRLRSDPAVLQIAKCTPAQEILESIKSAVAEAPKNLREAIFPYVCLVALSLKSESAALKEAGAIQTNHFDWYSYVASVLFEEGNPSKVIKYSLPGYFQDNQVSIRTDSSSSVVIIGSGQRR